MSSWLLFYRWGNKWEKERGVKKRKTASGHFFLLPPTQKILICPQSNQPCHHIAVGRSVMDGAAAGGWEHVPLMNTTTFYVHVVCCRGWRFHSRSFTTRKLSSPSFWSDRGRALTPPPPPSRKKFNQSVWQSYPGARVIVFIEKDLFLALACIYLIGGKTSIISNTTTPSSSFVNEVGIFYFYRLQVRPFPLIYILHRFGTSSIFPFFRFFWQIFRRCNIGTLKSNSCFMLTTKFNLETEKSHPRSSIEIFSSCLCAFFSLSASGSTCLFASSLLFISYSGISVLLYHFLKGKL